MIHSAHFVSAGRGLTARRDFHAPGADQTARTPRRRDRLSAASPAGLLPLPALACVAALALGLTATTAGAQDTILVTNNAQTTHTTYASVGVVAGFQYSGAQSFTTGAHANGYSLDSVRINSLGSNDRPVVAVSIHSNNSGVPGSELLQLIGGNSGVTSGLNNFRARGEILLAANTTYFVVVQGSVASSTFLTTSADAEDDNSAAGWSIGNSRLHRTADNVAWATQSNAMKLVIRGTPLTAGSPDAPRKLTAQAGNGQVTLQWMAPAWNGGSDITGYKIEVSTDGGNNWTDLVADTNSTDTTYSHTGLASSSTYHYQVSAINDLGTGPVSNTVSATTMSPASDITTPTANADGSDTLWKATLTVEEYLSGGLSYFGYNRLSSEGTLSSDSFTIDGTSYPVYELLQTSTNPPKLQFTQFAPGWPAERPNWVLHLDGTAFHASDADKLTLTSFEWDNPGLNWADEDEVAVKLVRLNAPTTPSNLTASAASSGRIDLSWITPSKTGGKDITGYKIEVSTDGGDNWSVLVADTGSTDTMYSHKGLAAGSTRHYQVSAINDIGTSPVSNTDSAITARDITTPTANTDGSDTLWTATLTVEEIETNQYGHHGPASKGALSSNSFTIDGTSYPVTRLAEDRGTIMELHFWNLIGTGFPPERANWVLHLGEKTFYVSEALASSNAQTVEWANPHLNWADEDEVAVRLVRLNAPTVPRDLTAQSVANTQINLSWSVPAKTGGKDITGYKIEVSTDGGNNWTDLVADTNSTDTTYSHTGLASSSTYHYQVSAINDLGTGPVSNTVSATTMSPASDITTPTANADGSDTLWKTTLTVEEFSGSSVQIFGYDRQTSKGTLSSDTFTIGGTDYPVTRLYVVDQVTPELQLWPGVGFPAERSDWVLYLDGTAFAASDAHKASPGLLEWHNPNLNWADDDEVAVRLVRLNAPTAPVNLTAQAVANTQINLSWSAPSKTGGSDITGYKIEVSTDGGNNWTDLVADTSSTETEYSDTGLTSGNTRTYRVSAINDLGTGAVSNTVSATAMSPASDITTPTANADGSDTLWKATLTVEEFSGSSVQVFGYDRQTSKGTLSSDTFTIGGTDYPVTRLYVVDSVTPELQLWPGVGFPAERSDWVLYLDGTAFAASDAHKASPGLLEWHNPNLNWADDDEVAVRLVRLNAPTAPVNLTAQAVANTQINLSWSAPSKTGGSDITGYKIEVSTDGGNNWTDLVADTSSTETEYSDTGLTSGNTRTYRVSAINDLGTGAVSNTDSATAMSPASDITTPTANADGSDTLWKATLTVEEFSGSSVQVFGYDRQTSKGTLSSDTFTIGGTDYPVTRLYVVDSVTPELQLWPGVGFPAERSDWVLYLDGTAFAASDAHKASPGLLEWHNPNLNWADDDEVAVRLVRLNAPTAPTNLYAKGDSNTQINLSWTAPSKTGGDISGYKIEVSTDGGNNWTDLVADTASTDTTHSHTGLSSGDTRHYRVSAINAAGTSPASDAASATAVASAPGLASAVVERTNSLVVRLEFDWVIDTTSVPDKSAFAVKVKGNPREVTSFTISDDGLVGRVGLASRVRPGQTVTLSYTKPETNPLKDAESNETASFTDYAVANETSNDFPILSVEVEDVHESGDGTTSIMTFTVSVDTEPDFPVGVHYETEDVTATGGTSCSGSPLPDYISTEGRLTLGPGESSKEVEVTVCDDMVEDRGETLRLVLRSTQLHEPISALGEIGPEGKNYKDENGEDEETASGTGTILNDETTTEVSIAADAAYAEEGTEAVFTLRRTGDAEEALTVPVSVEETGAMLAAELPENAEFAAGARETELRLPTDDDGANENDSTVTATLQADPAWHLAEGAASAALTVLDNDAAPVTAVSASDVTVWSADMTVVDYENGNIGAGSADLLANQGGSAGLQAKWLYYVTGDRKLKIAFGDGLDGAESMTLHVGDLSVAFPEDSGGDSSFTIGDVDVSWTDGETLAARVSKPSAEAVSTDATLKSLAVSDAAVSPAFDSGTMFYTAVVDSATASVTVSAESNDDDAEVAFVPSEDADSGQAGHQVAVPVGETLVTMTVTAADGQTEREYRVLVKRPPTVAVSFGSASYTATEGGAKASVIIELDADPGRDVTIPLTASPAGGADAEDYTVPLSVTFTSGGALSQGVVLTAVADDTAEEGESVVLGFGSLPDGVEAGATTSAAVTLQDAATEAVNSELSVADAEASEEEDTALEFVVTLDPAATATVTVDYATADGAATAGEDYTNTSGTLTFQAGDTTKTVSVPITDDAVDDGGETLTLTLSNASGADLGDAVATGTIRNTEAPETDPLTASFSSVPAEHDGETAFSFRVEFSEDVGVSYITLRDDSFTVTEGDVTGARRVNGRHDLWEITVEPDSREAVTISLAGGRDCGTSGAVCTRGDDPSPLSNSPSATVAGPPNDPLTASFSNMPAEHPGEGTFKFELTFSEEPAVGYQKLRDDAFNVSGGEVKKARRQQQGSNLAWDITVKPDPAAGAVTIELPATTNCNAEGAICTSDERPLSHSLSATVAGPVGISVADARAQEGAGNTVDFAVTLSRASSGTVTVGYATADGTATAGQDYTAASGTLTFAPGETSASVSVSVLDDTHDDDGETFTLRLSNASGGRLTDDSATGTIENSDAMPQAWLARFGRAASDHVVQAIGTRLRGGSQETPETHFTLGGRQAGSLFGAWDGIGATFAPTGADTGRPALEDESNWIRMDRVRAEDLAGGSFGGSSLAAGSPAGGNLAGGEPAGPAGGRTSGSQAARSVLMNGLGLPTGNLRDVLMGSSFFYSGPLDEDGQSDRFGWLGQWSAWGETAATRFSGADGTMLLNGEVSTAILGADSRWGRWLAGVTLSHSLGEGEYTNTGKLGGAVTSTLTSVNPYARYRLSGRANVWGVLGYGMGGLTLTPERAETGIRTDLTTTMAAFGGRGVLSRRSGRFQLAWVSDALVTNTASESVENLVGATGATSRLRLLLEGSGSIPLSTGGVLRPTLEVGLRYDGGDAETGGGIEVGGGLAYAAGRLAAEVRGRVLLAHEDKKYRESGYSASIAYTPSEDGRGLSMRLGSAWGATQSGVQSLWSSQDASGLTRGAAMDSAQRFQAELGYGSSGRGKADALWVPFVGAEAIGGEQALRMGVRFTSGPNVEMGLELGRRKSGHGADQASGPAAQHTVELRGRMRW